MMVKAKRALVCGAGGFIGGHLVRRLQREGFWVRGVDLKPHDFHPNESDEVLLRDLRSHDSAHEAVDGIDEIYQLAADMGGAGYVFTGEHDADIMHNSATINLNILDAASSVGVSKIFFSSSACVYPARNQIDPDNPNCSEDSAYPADPDSEYGWEKLFSERLYLSYAKQHGLNVRIARLHNIFGIEGTWRGGREKAPAAICRKVAEAHDDGEIEVWGDGEQTRSFLYVDDCIEGIMRLMRSDFSDPINIGSDEMVSINHMVAMIAKIAEKRLTVKHVAGPLGVRGRNSDNRLIRKRLGWAPSSSLYDGLVKTYDWIARQVEESQ